MQTSEIVIKAEQNKKDLILFLFEWYTKSLEQKKNEMDTRCRQPIKLTSIFVIKHLNED